MSNSGIFSVTPKVGVNLDAKGSTKEFALLDVCFGSNAKKYVYAIAGASLASTATMTIGTGGTASALTAGTYTVGVTGGVATGQAFWARQTAT